MVAPVVALAACLALLANAPARPIDVSVVRDTVADLALANPAVLVIGNSSADQDIDDDVLGQRLGGRAHTIGMVAAGAPTWLVLLRERVHRAGYRPRIVLFAGFAHAMLQTGLSDRELQRFVELAEEVDPLLDARLRPDRLGLVNARRRADLRDAVHMGIMGVALGAGAESTRWDHRLKREHDRADVFGDHLARPDIDLPKEGFLPDLVDEARRHGAFVAFVELPHSSRSRIDVPEEEQRRLRGWFAKKGVPYVDLSTPQLPDGAFDWAGLHLTELPARDLTHRLADEIAALRGGG